MDRAAFDRAATQKKTRRRFSMALEILAAFASRLKRLPEDASILDVRWDNERKPGTIGRVGPAHAFELGEKANVP